MVGKLHPPRDKRYEEDYGPASLRGLHKPSGIGIVAGHAWRIVPS